MSDSLSGYRKFNLYIKLYIVVLCLEEYESIKELLIEIAPRENSSQVNHWNTGGQIYLDYIKLWEKFNDIKVGATNLMMTAGVGINFILKLSKDFFTCNAY